MLDFFPIETPYDSKDYQIMKDVVDMGIDSHLEGFTKSKFKKSPHFANKFLWDIHVSELPILYRRLQDLYEKTGDEDYESFLEDVRNVSDSYKSATSGESPEADIEEPSYPMEESEIKEMIRRELNSLQESLGTLGLSYEDKSDEFPKMDENDSDSLRNAHGENLKPENLEESWGDRYEQIVFLQGGEADEAMDILNNDGKDAAMEYLKQWHYPGEHDARSEPGHGTEDRTYEKDGYIMAWNPYLPYIGLVYDSEHNNKKEPANLSEETERFKTLKDFAVKFNVTPTGQGGKFAIKDFDEAAKQFTSDEAFDFAMILANIYLKRKIGMDWDTLPDTNSLWDYVDAGMSATDLLAAAQDAAKERLSEEGFDLDEDSLAMRHRAGQRGKIGNMPLGQHSPHSQAAIRENKGKK